MPATIDEVKDLINNAFPGARFISKQSQPGRIVGEIIWDDFRNSTAKERNELVTKNVRAPLGMKGLNVGILVPLADENEI